MFLISLIHCKILHSIVPCFINSLLYHTVIYIAEKNNFSLNNWLFPYLFKLLNLSSSVLIIADSNFYSNFVSLHYSSCILRLIIYFNFIFCHLMRISTGDNLFYNTWYYSKSSYYITPYFPWCCFLSQKFILHNLILKTTVIVSLKKRLFLITYGNLKMFSLRFQLLHKSVYKIYNA